MFVLSWWVHYQSILKFFFFFFKATYIVWILAPEQCDCGPLVKILSDSPTIPQEDVALWESLNYPGVSPLSTLHWPQPLSLVPQVQSPSKLSLGYQKVAHNFRAHIRFTALTNPNLRKTPLLSHKHGYLLRRFIYVYICFNTEYIPTYAYVV